MNRFLLSVLCLLIVHFVSAQDRIDAENGMDLLTSVYQSEKSEIRVNDSSGKVVGDIKLACMGVIFLDWVQMYESVLKNTTGLRYDILAKYKEFKTVAQNIEKRNLYLFSMMRSDIVGTVKETINEMRNTGHFSKKPEKLSLKNPEAESLFLNLDSCKKDSFINRVDKEAPLRISMETQLTAKEYALAQPRVKTVSREDREKRKGKFIFFSLKSGSSNQSENKIEKQEVVELEVSESESTESVQMWLDIIIYE